MPAALPKPASTLRFATLAVTLLMLPWTAGAMPIASTHALPSDTWQQIAVPGVLPAGSESVAAVLGDDVPAGDYATNWIVYRYDSAAGEYIALQSEDPLVAGVGYWIIQTTGQSVEFDLPQGTLEPDARHGEIDAAGQAWLRVPIAGNPEPAATARWAMVGKPGLASITLADLRISASGGERCTVSQSCRVEEAVGAGLVGAALYGYDPVSGTYVETRRTANLADWQGYWIPTVSTSSALSNHQLLFPIGQVSPVAGFDDEFTADSLANWSRRHQVEGTAAQYSQLDVALSTPGALTLTPTRTPGWYQNGDAPLLFKTVSGNFAVETLVSADSVANPGQAPSANFNSAGLMARNPAGATERENYVMLNVGRQDGRISGGVGSEFKSTVNSTSQLQLRAGSSRGRLSLCRVGNTFYAHRYLDDDAAWIPVGVMTRNDMPQSLQVGMVTNGFSGPDVRASFEYIRLRTPNNPSQCTTP